MEIKIFEGKMSAEQEAFELKRIAAMVSEGYVKGEISNKDYRGWWIL